MPQRRTYLIAPDFTFQEKTGAIQIGNIIADPTRPHRTLSTITKEDLRARYPRIDSTPEDPHIIQNIDSKSESGTLWAKFISMASAELSAEHKSHTETKYEMDSIRTKQFVSDPDEAEIMKRVAVTKVQAVMNEKRFFDLGGGTPVYMISAVKIARGLRYASADIHGVGSSASASGEALTPAGDLSVGGMLSASHDRSRLDEGGLRVNVVFAYKVLIIEYAHWRGQELSVDEYLPKRKDGFLSSDNVGNKRQAEDADIGHPIVREAAESDLAPISEAVQVSQAQLNNEDELFMVVFPKRN